MGKQHKISLHKDELNTIGIDIAPLAALNKFMLGAHRDDHYMFIIQQQGVFVMDLDFNRANFKGASIGFVSPGQVHQYIDQKKGKGWFIFVDPRLVIAPYREIFDTFLHSHQTANIEREDDIFQLTSALEKLLKNKNVPLQKYIVQTITQTIVGIIASKTVQIQEKQIGINSQKYALVRHFKQLIKEKFKECKQVKYYASLLHITPLYLNEAVKEVTGLSASYWIHQEITLEAKRLLYYTDLNIMEIAYELGYDDYAYFSRFFKKNTGNTASAFREQKP